MRSTFIHCLSVLLNVDLIYCAHFVRGRLEDNNVTNVHTVNSPLHPSLSDGDFDTGKRINGVLNWTPKVQFTQTVNYYDLTSFVENLNLQHCVIVEIGEQFCALFVETLIWKGTEFTPKCSAPNEQFLGICDCATIRSWHLCRTNLKLIRREDCTFSQGTASETSSSRVHRRLCDITGMASWNLPCNCSQELASQLLTPVIGFPTCYLPPLPESICEPRNVCGTYPCTPVKGDQVYSAFCDATFCPGKNPFCEFPVDRTSMTRVIESHWSRWSTPTCNTTCAYGYMTSEAICHDYSGKPALDCIGPGSTCCSANETQCECHVIHRNDDVMLAMKILGPCSSYMPCAVLDVVHGKRQVLERQPLSTTQEENVVPQSLSPTNQLVEDDTNYNWDAQERDNLNSRSNSLNQPVKRFRSDVQRLKDGYPVNVSWKKRSAHSKDPKDYKPVRQTLEERRDKYENPQTHFAEMKNRENLEELHELYDTQDNHGKEDKEREMEDALRVRDMHVLDRNRFDIDEEINDSNRFEQLNDEVYEGHPVFDVSDHAQDSRPQSRKLLSFVDDYDDDNRHKAKKEDYVVYGHVIRKKDLSNGDFLLDLESKLETEGEDSNEVLYDEDDDEINKERRSKPNLAEDEGDEYDDDDYDEIGETSDTDDDDDDDDDDDNGDEDDDKDETDEDEEEEVDEKKYLKKKKKNCTTCDEIKTLKEQLRLPAFTLAANSGRTLFETQKVTILLVVTGWWFLR